MNCTSCSRRIRSGTGKRALVLSGKVAAMGVACASCARTGILLVVGDPDLPRPRKPRLGFELSEAPGVRGALARHLRGEDASGSAIRSPGTVRGVP